MTTCRCPMCGTKNAGKAGAKSFGAAVCGRDEHGKSWDFGSDRRKERRLRRKREAITWKKEI